LKERSLDAYCGFPSLEYLPVSLRPLVGRIPHGHRRPQRGQDAVSVLPDSQEKATIVEGSRIALYQLFQASVEFRYGLDVTVMRARYSRIESNAAASAFAAGG